MKSVRENTQRSQRKRASKAEISTPGAIARDPPAHDGPVKAEGRPPVEVPAKADDRPPIEMPAKADDRPPVEMPAKAEGRPLSEPPARAEGPGQGAATALSDEAALSGDGASGREAWAYEV